MALSGGSATITTDLDATVTVYDDGSFDYDPTGSATLNALNDGESETDTFTYTILDTSNQTYRIDLDPATARFDSLTDDDDAAGGFVATAPTDAADGMTLRVTFTPAAGDLDSATAAVNLVEVGGDANGTGLYLLDGEVHFISKMNGSASDTPGAFSDLDFSSGNNMIGVKSGFGKLQAGTEYTVTAIFDPITSFSLELAVDPVAERPLVDRFTVTGVGSKTNWNGDNSVTSLRAGNVGNFGAASGGGGDPFSEAAINGNPFEGTAGQGLYWSALANGSLVTPGFDFHVDAGVDTDGDAIWEDTVAGNPSGFQGLLLDDNPAVTRVTGTSSLPGITAAYDFPGGSTGEEAGARPVAANSTTPLSFQEATDDWSNENVTIEIWFKPDDLNPTPSNGQILFEDGGGTGFGFFIDAGELRLRKEPGAGNVAYSLSTDPDGLLVDAATVEFIQAVGTYDVSAGTMELFVNGTSVGTAIPGGGDWSGGDAAGFGTRADDNVGGIGSGQQNTESFDGQIAIIRVYRDQILTEEEVGDNFTAVAPATDTATVSILVTGVNDVPPIDAVDDDYTLTNPTDEDTVLTLTNQSAYAGHAQSLGSDGSLIGYWDFNEGSGSTAVDSSGNGNVGTITNASYTLDAGGFSGETGNYALDFGDGTGPDRVVIANAVTGAFNATATNNAVTVSFWQFGDAAQPQNDVMFAGRSSGQRQFQSHLPWSNSNIYWDTGGAGYDRVNKAAANDQFEGRWNHWTFVKDGNYKAVYVNGELFMEQTGANNAIEAIDEFVIGAESTGGANDYNGLIDEFAVFSRGLSPTEVAGLYAAGNIFANDSVIRGNLALGGTASQSSTRSGSEPLPANTAAAAIDGNTSGVWTNYSVTHTATGTGEQWWKVGLGEGVSHIDEIVVHNRTDCCSDRLQDFNVSVYDGDPDAGGTVVFSYDHAGQISGSSLAIDVEGNDPTVWGDFVRISQNNGQVLSLAEVQVFGESLTVVDYDTASEKGAAVTVNTDGSFSYDPTGADQLQALAAGESATDTFDYTIIGASGAGASTLIGHYPLDSVSGGTTPDTTTLNGNGTINGTTITQTAGKIGSSLDFAGGTGEFVGVSDAGFGKSTFTASIWFNPDSLGNQGPIANWTNAGPSPRTFLVRTSGSTLQTFVRSGASQAGGNVAFPTESLTTADFNHVVITYDGQNLRTYLNGELSTNVRSFGSPAVLGQGVLGTVSIGGRGSSEQDMTGLVDDVAFWSNTLTDGEVAAIFSLADTPGLNYDAGQADQLFQVFDGSLEYANIGGLIWVPDSGLGGNAGEIVDLGNGDFFLNLDGTAGVSTAAPAPTDTATVSVLVAGVNDPVTIDAEVGATITTNTGTGGVSGQVQQSSGGSFGGGQWHVKNTTSATTTRKGYIRMDVSDVDFTVGEARLDLVISAIQNQSKVVSVYGLTDESLDNWSTTGVTWANAPANNPNSGFAADLTKATLLGTFNVPSDAAVGDTVTFSGTNLVNFLNADTNGLVTFILGRSGGNTTRNFLIAGDTHATLAPPTLTALPVPQVTIDTNTGTGGTSGQVQRGPGSGTSAFGGNQFHVKNNGGSDTTRKGYLRFDASDIDSEVLLASLDLTVSLEDVSDPQTIHVFGITDGALDNWSTTGVTWDNAPANNTSSPWEANTSLAPLLGTFIVPADVAVGQTMSFTSPELVDFLNADTNDQVTFILGRTGVSDQSNLLFAGNHATLAAPTLRVYTETQLGEVTEDDADPTLSDTGTVAFTDVDLIDTHTATAAADAGNALGGTVTMDPVSDSPTSADGTVDWTYSVANSAVQYLALGETAIERFTVTVADALTQDTQPVMITVTGVNDDPVGNDDTAATDEDTVLNVPPGTLNGNPSHTSVLANDTDVDTGAVLTVTQLNGNDLTGGTAVGTSAKGAEVTLNDDGSFTYDPTEAVALQALTEGDSTTDTFSYTVADEHGATDTATVTVTVAGKGGVEINMNWLQPPASEIRLVLNDTDKNLLEIYADGGASPLQTTPLFNALNSPDIEVTGLDGASDTLIVDNGQGVINFFAQGGQTDPVAIHYDGGTGAGDNVLKITGDPAGTIALEQYDTANNTITFDVNGTAGSGDEESISFANVTGIEDDKVVDGTFEILATPQDDTIDIGAGTLGLQVDPGGSSTPIDFSGKTYTRINALGGDDTLRIAQGTTLTGSIDGGPGSDTLDYSTYTSAAPVTVDLADTDPGTGYQGTATGLSVGIVAGSVGSSIENVYAGAGNDLLYGDEDRNTLRDGAGNDILSGGPADDTYQLQPGGDSHDYLVDTGAAPGTGETGDWVDFQYIQPTPAATDTGVTIDMDITGLVDIEEAPGNDTEFDEVARLSVDVTSGDLQVDLTGVPTDRRLVNEANGVDADGNNVHQEVTTGNYVSLLRVDEGQTRPISPFENVRGTNGIDTLNVDPYDSIRYVDGLGGVDTPLTFDASGSEIIDTGQSITALGVGSVVYDNIDVVPIDDAPRVIDDGDPGFSRSGNWGGTDVEGYQGDVRFADAGNGDNVATWSFGGVNPGWYRVAVTWTPGANRTRDALFSVFDGSDAAWSVTAVSPFPAQGAEARFKQTTAPFGFSDEGTTWQELTDTNDQVLYFQITEDNGHTLNVRLADDQASGYAIADAVRIERVSPLDSVSPLESEIRVLEVVGGDRRDLTSGRGLSDLGTAPADGGPVQRTYRVQNVGLAAMTISVDMSDLPDDRMGAAAFDVTPLTATLAPGEEQLLTVSLVTTWGGRYAGTLRIDSSSLADTDENPFEIEIAATREGTVAAESDDLIYIDAGNLPTANTSSMVFGDFREVRRDTRFYDDDYLYNPGGGGGLDAVLWTATGLEAGQPYQVSATWAGGSNRATDAPFTITAGGETWVVEIDQNPMPNDFEENGTYWEVLGTFVLPTNATSLTVQLADNANGYVLADAVRVAKLVTGEIAVEQLVDLASPVRMVDEVSVVDFGYTELLSNNPATQSFTIRNEGGKELDITAIDVPAGFRMVESFDSLDLMDGTLDGKITLDEVGDPAAVLPDVTFTVAAVGAAPGTLSGQMSILSSDQDFGESPFDVTLTAQVGVQVIDNDNASAVPNFFTGGSSGFTNYVDQVHFEDDVRYHIAGDGNSWADWEFSGLTGGHYYAVSATWFTGSSRASNAPFAVYGGLASDDVDHDVSLLTEVGHATADQRSNPDDFEDFGARWEELMIVQVPESETSLTVRLTDAADNWVYADAVRMEQVYLPEVELKPSDDLLVSIESGVPVNFGTVAYLSDTSVDLTLLNAGLLPLNIDTISLSGVAFTTDLATAVGAENGQLGAGQSITFTVSFDTSVTRSTGTHRGEITFETNDIDETSFSIPLRATLSGSQTVDDQSGDFSIISGNFERLVRDTRAEGGTIARQAAGVGDNVVQWLFTDLPQGADYEVFATWMGGNTHATDAPFTVTKAEPGQDIDTLTAEIAVAVNQQIEPAGNGWYSLGVVTLTGAEDTLAVRLSDKANGNVIADSVRIVQRIAPDAEVAVDSVVQASGESVDFGSVRQSNQATPEAIAEQTVTVTNQGLQDLVLGLPAFAAGSDFGVVEDLNDLDDADGASDGKITLGAQGSITFTVALYDSTATAELSRSLTDTLSFTTNDPATASFTLDVSGKVVNPNVVDNGDDPATFLTTGPAPFQLISGNGAYTGGDYHFHAAGGGANAVQWVFTDRTPGSYELSVNWVANGALATDATYTVWTGIDLVDIQTQIDNNGSPALSDVTSQQVAHSGGWYTLVDDSAGGTAEVVLSGTDTTIVVQLTDAATGYVVADAARIATFSGLLASDPGWGRVSDPAPGSTAGLHQPALLTPEAVAPVFDQAVSYWAAEGLSADEANRLAQVNVRIGDLSGSTLGLASQVSGTVWIDSTAAGYGWNVDAMPTDASEINRQSAIGNWQSIDLLTVLSHELGHILGHDHDDHGLMAATLAPTTSGVGSGIDSEAATDRLPKSLAPVQVAFASLADLASGVFGNPASGTSDSDVPLPISDFDKTSAFDTLFARLDERAGELTDSPWDGEPGDEQAREGEADEDGLDLWSVLHGLE